MCYSSDASAVKNAHRQWVRKPMDTHCAHGMDPDKQVAQRRKMAGRGSALLSPPSPLPSCPGSVIPMSATLCPPWTLLMVKSSAECMQLQCAEFDPACRWGWGNNQGSLLVEDTWCNKSQGYLTETILLPLPENRNKMNPSCVSLQWKRAAQAEVWWNKLCFSIPLPTKHLASLIPFLFRTVAFAYNFRVSVKGS